MLDPFANMSIQDLPTEDLRWLAEDCGLDTVLTLMRSLRGVDLYVPTIEGSELPETVEQMPNRSMSVVAEMCGLPVALRLLKYAPRTRFYLPFPASCAWAKRWIRENFDGKNVLELAVALGVSHHFVYEVVSDMRPNRVPAWKKRKARKLADRAAREEGGSAETGYD